MKSNSAIGLWITIRSPVPKTSAVVNTVLAALWVVGYGLLVDAIKPTILMPCTVRRWGNERGSLVCSLYKTLLSTIAMVIIDTVAARTLKQRNTGITERERLLAKVTGETEYAPVWTGQSTTPVSMEPTRDERET
ncbi:uncharacterized protein B0J16DRAFT_393561 [Fusarium flagelliforme]|uniref:uncharacterized protein n=1 Tax=Fusarium flagelliforme TaxID=2675880 RepID=UPI001E8CA8B8|nr:uncharacterized protein B0J16DRAFT_393561 [Fusarium flagelliforme]KAH7169637.1 hypothetical protein B0J16DRAFT_393561 [Fusarium flagelliforme]